MEPSAIQWRILKTVDFYVNAISMSGPENKMAIG
jgi:hypothetical protein